LSFALHVSEFWGGVMETVGYLIALTWLIKTSDAIKGMPLVVRLDGLDWDIGPVNEASLTVVVPARDEAANIASTLDALLAADYGPLQILAIDDRSNDATGTIMEQYAERFPARMSVLHITELPDGWLGKTHALMLATEQTETEYLLFTDADVLFSPSILRRAMAYAEASEADHLVVLPTMQVKARGEGIVLGFFQIFGLWASRPWKIEDAESRRDVVGVGAFNLVRRDALSEIGGWAPQRLAVLEDITLGRRMKAAGMRQRIAFAPGLVLVHWAAGFKGLIRVMTKNLFSAFNFQPLLLVGACAWVVVFCLAPIVGLAWYRTVFPALIVFACIGAAYRVMGAASQVDARYGWLYPVGAIAFVWAMLRSMVVVLRQRGVVWRGTHYALKDLRQHNSPFVWERQARLLREEQLQAKKMVAKAKRKEERARKRG
jgi:glycosyltransferase involved in cell wall biosynthesis